MCADPCSSVPRQASHGRWRAAGVTLIELMVTLAVLAIVLGIGIPSFVDFVKNSRLFTVSSEIQTVLGYARSEAVTRRLPVSVCPSANGSACGGGWQAGLLVFADVAGDGGVTGGQDEILKYAPFTNASLQIAAAATTDFGGGNFIQFRPTGQAQNAGALRVCDDRTGNVGRLVSLSVTGRTETSRGAACS